MKSLETPEIRELRAEVQAAAIERGPHHSTRASYSSVSGQARFTGLPYVRSVARPRPELNRRPPVWQTGALSTELRGPRELVRISRRHGHRFELCVTKRALTSTVQSHLCAEILSVGSLSENGNHSL
jgi:hypothetical protein